MIASGSMIAATPAVRVLAADDSAVTRGILRSLFESHAEEPSSGAPRMELCGLVEDGTACLDAVERLRPDVVLLDLEMPGMHGFDVLRSLRSHQPDLPIIMCSSYTSSGARLTLEALALGAWDYIVKPKAQSSRCATITSFASELLPRIAAVTLATGEDRIRPQTFDHANDARLQQRVDLVVIGISTGGPIALESVLRDLPGDLPVPMVIAQHVPGRFSGDLAARLDRLCALSVKEVAGTVTLRPGTVWLAPGDSDVEVHRVESSRDVSLTVYNDGQTAPWRPSVDRLFHSAAQVYGSNVLAVVMTGMGSDGLIGARSIHQAGGSVLVQDRASSAVWGMPGRVFDAGLAPAPLPLDRIAGEIVSRISVGRLAPAFARVSSPRTVPEQR